MKNSSHKRYFWYLLQLGFSEKQFQGRKRSLVPVYSDGYESVLLLRERLQQVRTAAMHRLKSSADTEGYPVPHKL